MWWGGGRTWVHAASRPPKTAASGAPARLVSATAEWKLRAEGGRPASEGAAHALVSRSSTHVSLTRPAAVRPPKSNMCSPRRPACWG